MKFPAAVMLLVAILASLVVRIEAANIQGLTNTAQGVQNNLVELLKESFDKLLPKTFEDLAPIVTRLRQVLPSLLSPQNSGSGSGQPGVMYPILPPGFFPDPLELPPLNLIDFNLFGLIAGNLTFDNNKVEGLGVLTDDMEAGLIEHRPGFSLNYSIQVPLVSLNGDYEAVLALTSDEWGDPIPLLGAGLAYLKLNAFSAGVGLDLVQKTGAPDRAEVRIRFGLGLDSLSLFAEDMTVGGFPLDYWDEWSEFLTDISPLILRFLTEPLTNTLNEIVNLIAERCDFQELFDFVIGESNEAPACDLPPPEIQTTTSPPVTEVPTTQPPPSTQTPPVTEVPTTQPPPSTQTPPVTAEEPTPAPPNPSTLAPPVTEDEGSTRPPGPTTGGPADPTSERPEATTSSSPGGTYSNSNWISVLGPLTILCVSFRFRLAA